MKEDFKCSRRRVRERTWHCTRSCQLLPSDRQRQVSLPPCCSLPLGHISQHAHVRRGHTNCLSHPQTHWRTNTDTQPRGHALRWIYRRVWDFFFSPPSKLPLCRRNTASNKLLNPIISPSRALFPDIFHCSQSEVCFGTCHREWRAVWMCFLPTFPWNSLVNKPYMRCFCCLFVFFPHWHEEKTIVGTNTTREVTAATDGRTFTMHRLSLWKET